MDRRKVRHITLWLVVVLVILGCGAPALVTPPPSAPGPDSIETIIAQTAIAAQTETALVLPPSATPSLTRPPTKTLTVTPTPTATVLFLISTKTSVPIATSLFTEGEGNSTGSGSSGSGDGFVKPTATPQEWNCRVLSKSPANNTTITAGTSFKAIWTVQNTGTKTWPKKGVDVVYQSGAHLNTGKPYYDIPVGVSPGGTLRISVTMEVPKRPKDYSTRWSLMVGKTHFCSVQFVFEAR